MQLMNLLASTSWNFGSGFNVSADAVKLFAMSLVPLEPCHCRLQGDRNAGPLSCLPASTTLLRLLCPIFRPGLTTIFIATRIQRTANNMIANARKIAYATAANQNNAVFLQVVVN